MALRILNTLTGKVEEFVAHASGVVTMYTCGPTVYRYAHIGNLRSYLMADWLRRLLEHQGHKVNHIKNITDVGHMRQEMLERGEDKVIAAALAEGKSPEDIARYYTTAFMEDEAKLNILAAKVFPRATDHVPEMIRLAKRLMERGHAYHVRGNVYFSVASFPAYGVLSGNIGGHLQEGVRGELDPLKRDTRDFILWKAAEPGRVLKWSSPWGEGFPGWHIECSAMSMKYLGPQLDIHTGGVDNIFPHHEGEIAQSQGATGLPYVKYWVHGQHLLTDGVKMAKSHGNAYTLGDLESRGFDPMAFRYLCLTARFNSRLNFTFSVLRAAQRALSRLRDRLWVLSLDPSEARATPDVLARWQVDFWRRASDNLDMSGALATVWKIVRSDLPAKSKVDLLLGFDELLGLNLATAAAQKLVPPQVEEFVSRRQEYRHESQFVTADGLRRELLGQHYLVEDDRSMTRVRPMSELERRADLWRTVSSSQEVTSQLAVRDAFEFSVVVVACNYQSDVQRCADSALRWSDGHSVEVMVVDNGSTDGTAEWLEQKSMEDHRLRVIHTDHIMGEAAAKNIGLKQSLGCIVVMLDTSSEVIGDLYAALNRELQGQSVGVAGPFGLRTSDLRHFDEVSTPGEVDAMQAYCFALRRAHLRQVGLMPETFRFYRNLDIHYSFQFKDRGLRIRANPNLPVRRHTHRAWSALAGEERERLSHHNFRRFLKRWGDRTDLLVNAQSE